MTTAWRDVTLAELEEESGGIIQTGPFGSQLHASDYSAVGVPVVMPTNIRDLRVSTDGIARVSEEHVLRLARHRLQAGDIVYSRRGDVEKCALIGETQAGWLCGTGCLLVRVQGATVDAGCLSYMLSLPATRGWISQHAVGATMPNLNTSVLRQVPVTLPPIEEQRRIATTLRALDDKAESNRRLADLIPALMRAKVELALSQGSQEIPVARLARFVNGGAYTQGASGQGRMVLRIAELNSGPGSSTVYSEIDVPEDKTARPGDILMSWSGSLDVYRWARDEAIINQHIFKVITDNYPPWLIFDRLEAVMTVFQQIARDKATTMGHIQRGHLESTVVSLPSRAEIATLDREMAPLWTRLLLAEMESLKLSRIRDALLPELLSGRVRPLASAEVAQETAS